MNENLSLFEMGEISKAFKMPKIPQAFGKPRDLTKQRLDGTKISTRASRRNAAQKAPALNAALPRTSSSPFSAMNRDMAMKPIANPFTGGTVLKALPLTKLLGFLKPKKPPAAMGNEFFPSQAVRAARFNAPSPKVTQVRRPTGGSANSFEAGLKQKTRLRALQPKPAPVVPGASSASLNRKYAPGGGWA